ncbi:16S rRNA (guanine(527)-N(7))-methyltransferase RsmG [Caldimonas caldifontis]|uniref:Ribosomal RNA small subunit methyltransferase G n=1 Tax=Caldimonas caldifontis TaxID=1452508 RepID=A0A2S5SXZ7_9BURK|nr:16S rRNA (guanine(527)-N(7))-methyltransferase RsmG [Caldimonas caldifontis]PPE67437.1 16S rRNA (guanine(527)-N(7))-methyltransferase RsmG [Caldimonas caldifontis]
MKPALQSGLTHLGLSLSPTQVDLLLAYQALIAKWNRVYNLTAVRSPEEMLTHHLLDSLAVVPALAARFAEQPFKLLDVGAGAGLPGVVIAIALPQAQVICVDTVAKKASFIRQVAAELGLKNLRAEHARVEALPPQQADVVTSRAFASLADFVALTRPHLRPGGVWMAMKGKAPEAEAAELPDDVTVFHVEPLTVPGLDAERCLVWMRPTQESP